MTKGSSIQRLLSREKQVKPDVHNLTRTSESAIGECMLTVRIEQQANFLNKNTEKEYYVCKKASKEQSDPKILTQYRVTHEYQETLTTRRRASANSDRQG